MTALTSASKSTKQPSVAPPFSLLICILNRRHYRFTRWKATWIESLCFATTQHSCWWILGRDLWLYCKDVGRCIGWFLVRVYWCCFSEILYEDASFTQRELAALVASKVSCLAVCGRSALVTMTTRSTTTWVNWTIRLPLLLVQVKPLTFQNLLNT